MDIPSLSIAMSNYNTNIQLSTGVMKMALEQMELTGEMLGDMMDVAYVDMGSVIDVKL